jgi:hypothetical protein
MACCSSPNPWNGVLAVAQTVVTFHTGHGRVHPQQLERSVSATSASEKHRVLFQRQTWVREADLIAAWIQLPLLALP